MLVVLILTIATTLITFYYDFYISQNKKEISQKNFLEQQKSSIDMTIEISLKTLDQFEDDPWFRTYIDEKEEDPYTVAKVSERMAKILNPLSYMGYTIAVKKNTSDTVISPYITSTFEQYLKDKKFSDNEIKKTLSYLKNEDFINQTYYTISGVDHYVNSDFAVLYRKKYSNDTILDYLMFYYREENMPKFDDDEKEGFGIISNEKIICLSDGKWSGLIYNALKKQEESEGFSSYYNGSYYKIKLPRHVANVMNSSVIPNYSYVYLANTDLGFTPRFFLSSFIVAGLFLLIGSTLALINSKKIYYPINNIVDILKNYSGEDKTNEIEFITNSIIAIKNENDEMSDTLEKYSEPLKTTRFTEILYGLVENDEIERLINDYNWQHFLQPVNVAVIEFLNPYDIENIYTPTQIVEINQTILISITKQLEPYCKSLVLKTDYKRYTVIVPNKNLNTLKLILENTVHQIKMKYNISLLACIGKKVESLYAADASFNEAIFVLENKYITGKKAVISAEELKNLKENVYYYPLDTERNLINYMVNGDKDKAFMLLKNLLKINLNVHKLTKEGMVEFVYAIVATIKRVLQQTNVTIEEVFGEGSVLYLEIRSCIEPEKLREKILEVFELIAQKIHCKDEEEIVEETLIDRITLYVRKNYQKDISLSDLSDHFKVSQGYIGRLFSKHAGKTFKDYINMYRVLIAKEILARDSKTKIADISDMVGCNNVNTFIKMFKRYEGVTPGEYVKNINSDK